MRHRRVSGAFACSIGIVNRCFLLYDKRRKPLGIGITLECLDQVRRQSQLSWCGVERGVELDLDIDLVTRGHAGVLAILSAHRQHVAPAHPGHGAAVIVAVDGDPNRRALARPKALHDILGTGMPVAVLPPSCISALNLMTTSMSK